MSENMYRQGDVLLLREDAKQLWFNLGATKVDDLILAYGERTGHSHRVSSKDANLREEEGSDGQQAWLRVVRETTLRHEEHDPILLPAGVYRVILQRRYDPSSDRLVND